MKSFWKRTWTEINLDNLIYNFKSIKGNISPETLLCCVVKANAYGHNAPRVTQALEAAGADWFAVSNIEEAIELRRTGITVPILVLGYTPPECADMLSSYKISQCVYSKEYAERLSSCATANNCNVNIHIKLDTGMGRIGFVCNGQMSSLDEIAYSCKLQGLVCEGIFTHFAMSDNGKDGECFTKEQYDKFAAMVEDLECQGISFKYKHCANSAATIDYPQYHLNMVRVGISLYGLMPSYSIVNPPSLKPVMSLKTVVSHVKKIKSGSTISYGCDFVAPYDMIVATVPMGYADGFWRSNVKGKVSLLLHGKKAPIVGRICMDMLMLDVTRIDNVCMGDEVTVFGDSELINTVDDIARANDTISYEIICSVGKRVPRVFIKNSKVDGIHLGILDTTLN